jgi:hypothetical protein
MRRRHAKKPKHPRTLGEKTAYITEGWLKSVHITPRFLSDTSIPTEFLMAQKEAETLLRSFPHYLSESQSYQLVQFLKRLKSRKHRDTMPISLAHTVLNIAAKVNRQCFAEHRKLQKNAR